MFEGKDAYIYVSANPFFIDHVAAGPAVWKGL
jgi:hypothetical protein